VEPVWNVPISENYFKMINSFRVEVFVHFPLESTSNESGTVVFDQHTALRISNLCDQLHLLVAKLRLRQQAISRLDVAVSLLCTRAEPAMAQTATVLLPAVEALLNPFRRLCQIDRPRVVSIAVYDSRSRELNILRSENISHEARAYYDRYLNLWTQDLSNSEASLEFIQVLRIYQRVVSLISMIMCFWGKDEKIRSLIKLLEIAKMARETRDVKSLRGVWDRVGDIWFRYIGEQEASQSKITGSILASHVLF
jgi:hypothetical protein